TLLAGTDRLLLRGEVWNVPGVDQERVAHLKLHLTRAGAPREVQETLLSTGLTVPLGQSVVLGSAVTGGKYQALVLTLRAEVVQEPR
ncbi:MAG TPA: hypothetical protein VJ596_10955, partial [Gemmatimonadaceae bacterium]|nr:hypothetical protein [Gemmatimonadaceae bacterium]